MPLDIKIKNEIITLIQKYVDNDDEPATYEVDETLACGLVLFATVEKTISNYQHDAGDYWNPPFTDYDVNLDIIDIRLNYSNDDDTLVWEGSLEEITELTKNL